MMFVDAALLRSGANETQQASGHAHQAAEHLSGAVLLPQMFGGFSAAESFQEATGSVQIHHARLLLRHKEILGNVGRGAVAAATQFTDMEVNNSASLRAVRCNSDT
ncbi:DUF2563 family protein [Mycobacterium paragordonae]|jgi:hypothetical protein|uniref:DUF2563 family protein n=1 Tax=Mycobacterium paragordonae TaxID=1389713 RepID=UPI000ADF2499|nr:MULTISPECIES: DUF2563 family protein [Mycobacterium]